MSEQIIGKKSTKEEYTPEQLRVMREYENAGAEKIVEFANIARNKEISYVSPIVVVKIFKGAYHVPNALENTSPLANVQNAHENSSFTNSISNFS